MSRNTIDLEFGDGEYLFALPLPQIQELQRKTNTGIGALHARVMKGAVQSETGLVLLPNFGEFYVEDLIETVRQGLIGGAKGVVDGQEVAVTPMIAKRLMETYVVTSEGQLRCTLYELWTIAYAVLGVTVCGFNPPKKDQPAKERAPRKRKTKASSTSA